MDSWKSKNLFYSLCCNFNTHFVPGRRGAEMCLGRKKWFCFDVLGISKVYMSFLGSPSNSYLRRIDGMPEKFAAAGN